MTNSPSHDQPPPLPSLRERAQTRLHTNHVPAAGVAKNASDALRVLFDLASSPATAHDALALLHELQVHQVELDLQNEEMQSSRTELEAAWTRQNQLHNASPSAQLVLDSSGCLVACNAQALQCFAQSWAELLGKPMDAWIDPMDRPRVHEWRAKAQQSASPISLGFSLSIPASKPRAVWAAACANPLQPGVLISWVDAPDSLA
jgi:hypothetical protein